MLGPLFRRGSPEPEPEPEPAAGPAADELARRLYREYHGPLMSYVLRQTGGDRHWAEDIVQETLLRAWRNADRIDHNADSLMPWLATVARRIVIDERRSRSVRPQEVGEESAHTAPGAVAGDGVDALLHTMEVGKALRTLSPAHREILVETLLRDRSVNEAAQALDIPVGTVKSRVYYAVRALRAALEESGVTTA